MILDLVPQIFVSALGSNKIYHGAPSFYFAVRAGYATCNPKMNYFLYAIFPASHIKLSIPILYEKRTRTHSIVFYSKYKLYLLNTSIGPKRAE